MKSKKYPNFDYEIGLLDKGYFLVAGVDEVGRGALAGPIVASAVVFNPQKSFRHRNKITDSKLLSDQKRRDLVNLIKEKSIDYSIGFVNQKEIDRFGIGCANVLAFRRALLNLKNFDFALIDGRRLLGFDYYHQCIIKGDRVSISIAAASILAKVQRDDLMKELEKIEPKYNFDLNKGYGTKDHIKLIAKYGPGIHHRKSFLKNLNSFECLF